MYRWNKRASFLKLSSRAKKFCRLYPTIKNYSILECSGIGGMYDDGRINIIYENRDLRVKIRNSSSNNIVGKVKPSCEGSISFNDYEQETFEFNEKDKEINWYSNASHARNKWIKGWFCKVIRNVFIHFK